QQMIATLADYQGTTLFVTHNLEEAYRICPNLLVMDKGQQVHYGSKYEIFEHPATVSVAQLTGCKNFSQAIALARATQTHLSRENAPQQIEAVDWGCTLRIIEPIPDELSSVGIRAHHITFKNDSKSQSNLHLSFCREDENTFPCWLVKTIETPHRMTLFLKLHSSGTGNQDYHLIAEVFKEKWTALKDQPFPWYVHLDPMRLILMSGER
ncbi:MAG: hypothetical protein ICV78_06280, partial [Tolypothrix sp. Co-bin9]|nr:hypothetical protein [Tolypothrix sp. Co-bin9]